jgi:hypothetical protein
MPDFAKPSLLITSKTDVSKNLTSDKMRKSFIKIISILFPNQVVAFAYKQLTNPQIKKLRPNELIVLDKSEKEILKFQDFDIQLYTWKGGENKILLIHGWEGQAGNFADIVEN